MSSQEKINKKDVVREKGNGEETISGDLTQIQSSADPSKATGTEEQILAVYRHVRDAIKKNRI